MLDLDILIYSTLSISTYLHSKIYISKC